MEVAWAGRAVPAALGRSDRRSLALQRLAAWGLTPVTYAGVVLWMRAARGYRVERMREHRAWFRRELGRGGPVLVCANHLTLIDSMILMWAMGSCARMWLRPRQFPWNLPERRNFFESFGLRALCWLGKCVPVVRQGPPEESRRAMGKVEHLLRSGEAIMIFPEGTRSRSGRVDAANGTYGVGTLLQAVSGTRVICAYLRGRGQSTYGDLPRRGETFDLSLGVLSPRSEHAGLRGARDLSRQVLGELERMEKEYLARDRQ